MVSTIFCLFMDCCSPIHTAFPNPISSTRAKPVDRQVRGQSRLGTFQSASLADNILTVTRGPYAPPI